MGTMLELACLDLSPKHKQRKVVSSMNTILHDLADEVHETHSQIRPMFRVTTQKKRCKVMLTIEGRLAGESVSTLEHCWRELRAASPTEKFNVDLCGVSFIDAAGKSLLKEIHRQGGHLVAEGCLNQATVKEITAEAEGQSDRAEKKPAKKSHIIFYIAFFSLL